MINDPHCRLCAKAKLLDAENTLFHFELRLEKLLVQLLDKGLNPPLLFNTMS
jgi:hypothetical protein